MSSSTSLGSQEAKQYVASNANDPQPITEEPQAPSMDRARQSIGGETILTMDDNQSGYHRESNECTEFCADLFMCFGACDACCPLSGEGCLSSMAAFFGNICVTCWKC